MHLFSNLNTKRKGICEGASKQFTDPKNATAPGPHPKVWIRPCISCLTFLYVTFIWIIPGTNNLSESFKQKAHGERRLPE